MSEILGIQILKVSDTEKNEINQMVKKRDEYRMQKTMKRQIILEPKLQRGILFLLIIKIRPHG